MQAASKAPRIVIENITPRVEGGPFAAKRIVGQKVTVEADAYGDGHDVLAVELLWKAADEEEWHRLPMAPLVNARWRAAFTPHRIGRWQFTVEAWLDEYATLCRAIRLKREAGVDIAVELAEVRLALEAAIARKACTRTALADVLATLAKGDIEASVEALISPRPSGSSPNSGGRHFVARHEPLALDVDRREAGFASWYELFPRSQTDDPARHGTFADVIAPPAAHPRHGLRRPLFPADPSDRRHHPQGPQQQPGRRRRRISAAPTRSAAARAATTRSIRHSARSRISAG